MANNPEKAFGHRLVMFIGGAIILYAVLLFVNSCLVWLQTGVWFNYTAAGLLSQYGIDYPRVSWVGVQKLIDGLMSWPASLVVGLIGVLFLYIVARPKDHC